MGISGLLPFLKEASTNVNIRQFEGSTVAVDTYCWIYRGAFGCAEQLALGQPTDGHVKYVMKYVTKLLEWGIKPIMIFDGGCLPSKRITEVKRKESKENYKNKARHFLKEGRVNEARECYQRCIECTPQMALDVIKALHKIGVDVIVAPHEADAQLAYLNKINVAQIVITEDSDLILFGCEKIIYKMDINGNGNLIEKEKIIQITQFDSADNFERFRWMCIMSGCDYLENLPGVGLGKAKKLLKSIKKSDIEHILKQIPKVLKVSPALLTDEYIEKFIKADKTFKYQVVFDPIQRKRVPLNPYQAEIEENEDLSYAGDFLDEETALQHSLGNLNVNDSKTTVYDFIPEKWNYKPPHKFSNNPPPYMRSVWSKSYQTYKKCNPFMSCIKQKSEPANLSNKTDSNILTNKFGFKRKLQPNEHNENDKENSSEMNEKRLRLIKEIDTRIDIDDLLSSYTNNSNNQSEQKKEKNEEISSPLLTKKPKFVTENGEDTSSSSLLKKSQSSTSQQSKRQNQIHSPIVICGEKSSYFSSNKTEAVSIKKNLSFTFEQEKSNETEKADELKEEEETKINSNHQNESDEATENLSNCSKKVDLNQFANKKSSFLNKDKLEKEHGDEELFIFDSKSPPLKIKTQLVLEDIRNQEQLKTDKSQSKKKNSTSSKASHDDKSNQNIKNIFQNLAQFNFTKQNRLVNNLN